MVDQIDDHHAQSSLSPRLRAALGFADAFLAADGEPSAEVRQALQAEFSDDELVEMGLGLALFHGFSKLIVALGCEPDAMSTTELRTPGS